MRSKKVIEVGSGIGVCVNIVALLLGLYFNLTGDMTFSVVLGDNGSITSTLLKGFAISSGRGLLYLSVYGMVLTAFSKKAKLKEFYSYYMLAIICVSAGSLLYFIF